MEGLCVAVGIGLESVLVYDPFVEDESVAFGVRCYFELFGGWVSVEEVGVDDRDVPSFVEGIKNFVVEVLTHDVIVKFTGLSLRAGGRGFSPATTSPSPGYFDTKRKYWKEKNASNYKMN